MTALNDQPMTWLDTAEVAARTRTPESTVRSWRRSGIGPAYCRVGRRVLYAVADVDAFIVAGRVETSGSVSAPGPERPAVRPSARAGGNAGAEVPTDLTTAFIELEGKA